MKANEIDIVRLTEEVQGFPANTQATVVVAFSQPSEAYDLEVVHGDGSGDLLYAVLPEQFEVVEAFRKEAEGE